jgi:triphosphatase
MNNEIELKLLIAPADVRRLQRLPLLKGCTRRTLRSQRLVSVYYDTPALDLNKHGVAVRLRRVGRRWIQTVKTAGTVAAGLHDRPEWERETQGNTLDVQAILDAKLHKSLNDETLLQALRPVFTTEFTRSRRIVELPGGTIVEFALDRGEIRANGKQSPICEVELELKSGDPAQLFTFALSLQDVIPLRLENTSKAERGYRLATNAQLTPVKAETPKLTADLSVHEAFAHIVQSCLTQLQANEEGVLQGDDPEFVHQARVAVRRLRSAFSVFSDLVPKEQTGPLREDLRWLAGELDGARNWDVFTHETLPPILAAFPEHEGLAWVTTESGDIRRQYHLRARAALASPRYQKLLLALGAWLSTQPWRTAAGADADPAKEIPLVEFTAAILRKRHKQLKKRGKNIASLAPAERHSVRIAAKKLRYAAEFFSSLYARKPARDYIAALSDLQDVLGALNDAATTVGLLSAIEVADKASPPPQARDLILGWVCGASHTRLKELEGVWGHFVDQKPFW